MIIVDGDPSKDIAALSRVRIVMSDGIVARDELTARQQGQPGGSIRSHPATLVADS